jgi:hypothetical protein
MPVVGQTYANGAGVTRSSVVNFEVAAIVRWQITRQARRPTSTEELRGFETVLRGDIEMSLKVKLPTAATIRTALRINLENIFASTPRMRKDWPDTLYHYADSNGLLGIARSRKLWASDYQYMNDSSEFQYAVEVLKRVVRRMLADVPPQSPGALLREYILSTTEHQSRGHAPKKRHYLACFSEHGDSLSQWRGYARGIGGYALGFAMDHICAVAEALKNRGLSASVFRCEYDEERQDKHVVKVLGMAVQYLDELTREADETDLTSLVDLMLVSLTEVYKHPSFRDEREWRLIVSDGDAAALIKTNQDASGEHLSQGDLSVEFRSGEFTLIPYVAVPLVLGGSLGLREVVVGPTPVPEIAAGAVRRLLTDKSLIVRPSNVPFRKV